MKKREKISLVILLFVALVCGVLRINGHNAKSTVIINVSPPPVASSNENDIKIEDLLPLPNPTEESKKEEEIVEEYQPLPVEGLDYDIVRFIHTIANENNYPPELLLSLAKKESDFNITLYSATNDAGLFQINQCNWNRLSQHFGCTIEEIKYDPYWNSKGCVYLLNEARNYYPNESPHIWLMVYNMGLGGAQNKFKEGIFSTNYSREIITNMDIYK